MPLFEWEERSYCGDAPETTCPALAGEESVKAAHGTSLDGGCPVDITSPDHPAIMVCFSSVQTELRSGTVERPIPIDLVQRSRSMSAPTLLFRNSAGNLVVWQPDSDCAQKKVIFDGGDFKLVDDVNSNVFEETCIGAFSDAEYIAGARLFIDCAGNQKVKLIFFPVSELP